MDMTLNKELERKFPVFLKNIGKEDQIQYAESIIVCDSDKCDQYRAVWEKNNIPFIDGVMIYLITKMKPYCDEARITISPSDFVIKYFNTFKEFLPSSKNKKEEIMDKKWYTMYLSAEEQACGNVFLTKKEAKIVKDAIDQMYDNLSGGGWCGSVGIDIEHPRTDRFDFGSEEEI